MLEQKVADLRRQICNCESPEDPHRNSSAVGQEEVLAAAKFTAARQQLLLSQPVPMSIDAERIAFGVAVILSKNEGPPQEYIICGDDEPLDAWPGRIPMSVNSPVGQQLIGKQIGSEVSVTVKGVDTYYEVLGIGLLNEESDQPEFELPLETVTEHG